MRSDQLTGDQLEALADRVRPMLREALELRARMEKAGFEPTGERLVLTSRAAAALHYLGCGGVVGRPPMRP